MMFLDQICREQVEGFLVFHRAPQTRFVPQTLPPVQKHTDIRTLRKTLGWTQDRLARFLGVDRSSVAHMENGRPVRGPVARLMAQLADAADRGVAEELFPDEELAG